MKNDFLIVHKKILPDYYEKVVEARTMLRDGQVREVSEAVRRVGISRSTYYKYKDYIFRPSEENGNRKAVLSLMLSHRQGTLSRVLNALSDMGANICTIMQNPPMNGRASIVITADIDAMTLSTDEALAHLSDVEGVEHARLLDIG